MLADRMQQTGPLRRRVTSDPREISGNVFGNGLPPVTPRFNPCKQGSGDQSVSRGVEGAALGALLKDMETEWVDSGFSLERDALLERAAERLGA